MELFIIALVVVGGAFWYYNRKSNGLDVNQDGKVDATDAKAAVDNVVSGVKETVEEVKAVEKKVVAKAKDTAAKVKKPRKPKASA